MKMMLYFTLLFSITNFVFSAENPFKRLPHNIKLLETTESDIKNSFGGTCIKWKESRRYGRDVCWIYDVKGKYEAYISDGGDVYQIVLYGQFDNSTKRDRLPGAWVKSGENFSEKSFFDMTANHFYSYIKTLDDVDLLEKVVSGRFNDGTIMSYEISFLAGENFFTVSFWSEYSKGQGGERDYLSSIIITSNSDY